MTNEQLKARKEFYDSLIVGVDFDNLSDNDAVILQTIKNLLQDCINLSEELRFGNAAKFLRGN